MPDDRLISGAGIDSLTVSKDPSGSRQAAADDQAAQIEALKSELESLKQSVAAMFIATVFG